MTENLPCPFCNSPAVERNGFMGCGNHDCWMNDAPGVKPELWNNQPARTVIEMARNEMFYFMVTNATHKKEHSYGYLKLLKERFTMFLKTPERKP